MNPLEGVVKLVVPLLLGAAVLPIAWVVASSYWQGKPETVTWGSILSKLTKLGFTQVMIGALLGGSIGATWAGGMYIPAYIAAGCKWLLDSIAAAAGIPIPPG